MKDRFYVPPFKDYFIPDIIGDNSFCRILFGTNKSEVKSKIQGICFSDVFTKDASKIIDFKFIFEHTLEHASVHFENDLFSSASFQKSVKDDDCTRIYNRLCKEICGAINFPCTFWGDYPHKRITSDAIYINIYAGDKYEDGKKIDGMKSISIDVRKSMKIKKKTSIITAKSLNYVFAFLIIVLAYLFALNSRYRYVEKSMLRIDNWTGNIEVYNKNGVWKVY